MPASLFSTRLLAAAATLVIAIAPVTPVSATGRPSRDSIISFAGQECEVVHPIAADDAPPYGVGACPGVRPGALVQMANTSCTLNFMFKGYRLDELGNRVEAGTFMGTAGHCIFEAESDEVVWEEGTGPEARDAAGVRIGEFAYAVDNPTRDFALIRLDPGVQANPQMCHFGGPTGLNADSDFADNPEVVQHFGQGLVFGETVSARSGVGHSSDPNWHLITTAAIFGDSGSGVETEDGRAIGVLVAIGPLGVVVTRLAPQIEPARVALELDSLELQTAPEL